jgi:hypothetical protein
MTKISIHSNEFTQPIAEAFDHGEALVIWHQIPWAGGNQEWFLIHRFEALDVVLKRGRVASAFTAYEWIEVPTSRQVTQEWLAQASTALAQETFNLMLLIQPVTSDSVDPIKLIWVGEADDLQEYYEQHSGSEAVIGRIPSIPTGEIIRGYYPDANGIPQSGPY